MSDLIFWMLITLGIIIAGLALLIGFKAYFNGTTPGEMLFKPRVEPRLSVIEYANVDGRRRLLLVRRDDVEHLIMTGGPVDVVIETGIGERPLRTEPDFAAASTAFARQPPNLVQTATP